MMFKLFTLCAVIAIARAGLLPVQEAEAIDSHPNYSFSYDVQDAQTGDVKSQSESRDGDIVRGQYALNDADGYRRIVDYSVDADSGFKASVHREPLTANAPIAVVAPEAPAAPILQKLAPSAFLQPAKLDIAKPQKLQISQPSTATAYHIRAYSTPTLVHHTPAAHTVYHSAPTVHLSPATTHYVHHSAPTATLLKTSPAVITHHHAPAALVRTSFSAPHISYVY